MKPDNRAIGLFMPAVIGGGPLTEALQTAQRLAGGTVHPGDWWMPPVAQDGASATYGLGTFAMLEFAAPKTDDELAAAAAVIEDRLQASGYDVERVSGQAVPQTH